VLTTPTWPHPIDHTHHHRYLEASDKVKVGMQLRALLALCSVVPTARVAELKGCEVEDIREHMLTLHYLDRLASVDVQYVAKLCSLLLELLRLRVP
jgi:hypothetical protein